MKVIVNQRKSVHVMEDGVKKIYKPGDLFELSEDEAQRLEESGFVRFPEDSPAMSVKPNSTKNQSKK